TTRLPLRSSDTFSTGILIWSKNSSSPSILTRRSIASLVDSSRPLCTLTMYQFLLSGTAGAAAASASGASPATGSGSAGASSAGGAAGASAVMSAAGGACSSAAVGSAGGPPSWSAWVTWMSAATASGGGDSGAACSAGMSAVMDGHYLGHSPIGLVHGLHLGGL